MALQAFSHRPPAGVGSGEVGNTVALTRGRALGGAAMAACAALAVLAGGCAGGRVTRIADEAAFQQIVINADQPVLVDFYKGGCATCIPLDGVMDQLVEDYKGRAVIAKFETMTGFFGIPSRPIKERYDIVFFPTAILFVNGQEKKRWIIRYGINGYRKELDQVVSPATTQTAAAGAGQFSEKE
jgi:thioredoxin 1